MIELRDIEIFLTLAEELHFGRTAERLHITPARVRPFPSRPRSDFIGGQLFERNTRNVRLTRSASSCGAEDLSDAHRQITEAVRDTSRTASPARSPSAPWAPSPGPSRMDLFQVPLPDVDVQIREIHPTAPLSELRAGGRRRPRLATGPTNPT